jgi:DNA-nicking Smr family endonuclease
MWLGMPDFRGLIVAFESAAIGHGGEGALYVSLAQSRGD